MRLPYGKFEVSISTGILPLLLPIVITSNSSGSSIVLLVCMWISCGVGCCKIVGDAVVSSSSADICGGGADIWGGRAIYIVFAVKLNTLVVRK